MKRFPSGVQQICTLPAQLLLQFGVLLTFFYRRSEEDVGIEPIIIMELKFHEVQVRDIRHYISLLGVWRAHL
jgi:hypothetical protein